MKRSEHRKKGEVLFNSHRGFSPVEQMPNRVEEPFQRLFLEELINWPRNIKLPGLIELQGKQVSQERASAAKQTVKTVHLFFSFEITGLKPRCE
jgi:hypothetical protein